MSVPRLTWEALDEFDKWRVTVGVAQSLTPYGFLEHAIDAALRSGGTLTLSTIKALHRHVVLLGPVSPTTRVYEGRFREFAIRPMRDLELPDHSRVVPLMDALMREIRQSSADPLTLAAYVLWRMINIHPFSDGNGRTACAACYFVFCTRAGVRLPGTPILPELIRRNNGALIRAVSATNASFAAGRLDLSALRALLWRLLGYGSPPRHPSRRAALPVI